MNTLPHASNPAAAAHQQVLERIVTSFEQALKKGESPKIETYLQEAPPAARGDIFAALLRAELTILHQQKKAPALQHYLARFPDKTAFVSSIYQQLFDPTETKDMDEEWFFLRNKAPVGPFEFNQLQKLARVGDLQPKDMVSKKGTVGWSQAATVSGLFSSPRATQDFKQPAPGQWIREDYVLLEMIGRGGMGEIYKAYRFALQKEIALKIVRFDRFLELSPERQENVLQGFRKEMQATANLRHDHIVTIHDTGDLHGLPFYTMDLGESSLAQQLHSGPLPAAKAAEYMERIARAVEFAHQHGFIHRDIKPHNVLLVGGKPVLADLGLAAVQDRLLEGQEREVAGSPPYMAPEQVLGQKLDARTDIYGIGATLYHLITGRPPHQSSEREQVYDQVARAEPVPPRKLNPAIDRDLEAITLKCLEKDPQRRYATAGQLAADLTAYREGKPVTAKRPMPWHRLYKWARREPLKASLAGAIVLLILVLFLRSSIHNRQLSAALDDARTAQAAAEKNETKAKEHAKEADRQRDEKSQEQRRSADLANILGMRVLSKFKKHDDPRQAAANLVKHAEICEQLLRKKPQDEIKLDLVDTYLDLSNIYLQLQKEEEAASYLDKCIQLQHGLRERYPVLLIEAALNYIDLGGIYGKEGHRLKEMESDHKALEILEELRGKGYVNPPILGAMAEAHTMLATDYFFIKSDRAKGLLHQKEAVAILEKLNDAGERGSVSFLSSQRQLAKAYQNLAVRLVNPKEAKDALAYFDKAKDIFAGKSQYRQNLAEVELGRGRALVELGLAVEAMSALHQADTITGQLLSENDDKTPQGAQVRRLAANVLSAKARAYQKNGDPDQAEKFYLDSLDKRTNLALRPGNETFLVDGHVDLANFYEKEKKSVSAIKHWNEAIRIQSSYVAQKPQDFTRHREAGVMWFNKGIFLFNIRDYKASLPCFLEAQTHEIKALDLSKGEASYSDSLFSTYQMIFRANVNLSNFEQAAKSVMERRKFWSKDRDKLWESAKDLAAVFERSPEHLSVLIDFLDLALADKMLEVNSLRNERLFEGARARPEFDRLMQKHAGK